jgi:DNA-binding NarL/FixJ family response regulator
MRRRPTIRFVGEDPNLAARSAIPIEELPERPYAVGGIAIRAVVDSAATASEVLRALARGADAVVHLQLADAASFVDATQRLADVSAPTPAVLARDQRELLDLLATGHTLSDAAAELGMSSRTAHRRLAAARATLGATSNIEAIAHLHG